MWRGFDHSHIFLRRRVVTMTLHGTILHRMVLPVVMTD
jgi:hypothetical protein